MFVRFLCSIACLFITSTSAYATTQTMPLGTVSVTRSDYLCNKTYKCWDITISCPGVQDNLTAVVYKKDPVGTDVGTVTFHSGAQGTGLWDGTDLSAKSVITDLNNAGYRIVQVRFNSDWSQGSALSEGVAKLACRSATAIRWVYDNIHVGAETKPFCSTGNSGGAAQLGYAVTRFGLGSIIDALVPTAGPTLSRIDDGCLTPDSNLYLIGQFNVIDRSYGTKGKTAACTSKISSYLPRFIDDSIVLGDWSYYFPTMYVHQLLGEQDTQTAAIGQGNAFHDTLYAAGSPMSYVEMVPEAAHTLHQTVNGAARIKSILLNECRLH